MSILTKRIKLSFMFLLGAMYSSVAQGVQGIEAANQEIRTYIAPVGDLILGIAAVVGTIGAVRVYIAWNNGDQDITKKIMGWLGAILFIVLTGLVVRAFFGV